MKYRYLDMSDDLFDSLRWWWENRTIPESPYVFTNDLPGPYYGKPYKHRRQFLKGLCKRAGVKPMGYHTLRRWVASVLVDMYKISLKKVQMILGHSNVSTTVRYIYNVEQDMKSTMNLLSVNENGEKGGSDQIIPLNDAAMDILLNHPKEKSEYVFPGQNGKQRVTASVDVNRIKERAGLPKNFRPLHGFRHVYASMLASSGKVDMYTLQKLLTHKDPRMTQFRSSPSASVRVHLFCCPLFHTYR